jgi:methylamine dehydrogenase accessory protein MauD
VVEVKSALVVSHILLWVAVVVQGIVLVALMRQVGTLLLRVGSTKALDAGYGPGIGEETPWSPDPIGEDDRPVLLMFLSPSCGTCSALVPAVNAVARGYASTLRVMAVLDASEPEVSQWTHVHRLRTESLASPEAYEALGIQGTPYAFVISNTGRVQGRGTVNHIEHIESLLRRCDFHSGPPGREAIDLKGVYLAERDH